MHIKKKWRTKLILLAILVFAFVYWRGIRAMGSRGFSCSYQVIYSVCTPKNNKAQLPSFWEILKDGVKF